MRQGRLRPATPAGATVPAVLAAAAILLLAQPAASSPTPPAPPTTAPPAPPATGVTSPVPLLAVGGRPPVAHPLRPRRTPPRRLLPDPSVPTGTAPFAPPAAQAPQFPQATVPPPPPDPADCHWGVNDTYVGLPAQGKGYGGVDAQLAGLGNAVLSREALGFGAPEADDHFGAALAGDMLTGYDCLTLVVGAPGEGKGGRVYLVPPTRNGAPGGAAGERTGGVVQLLEPDRRAGDGFGTSVAVTRRYNLDNSYGTTFDLWVGAPGRDVNGRKDAGAVFRFPVTADGVGGVTVGTGVEITQDSPGIPGTAEVSDRFGLVLARDWSAVAIGSPYEDIDEGQNAGMVTHLVLERSGDFPIKKATNYQEGHGSVPDTPEDGDHFGAAVTATCGKVTIGVPDEDVGRKVDAGIVIGVQADLCGLALNKPWALSKNTAGVPGGVQEKARFGAALTGGYLYDKKRGGTFYTLAIGVPGEIQDKRDAAGSVVVWEQCGSSDCVPYGVRQGLAHGPDGTPETGDRFGATLGVQFRSDNETRFVTGIPGEDRDDVADAGLVENLRQHTWPQQTDLPRGLSTGDLAGAAFGSVVGSDFVLEHRNDASSGKPPTTVP